MAEQQMTGQQALQTMDQVGAAFVGNRAQHVSIQAAVATLAKIVGQHEEMMAVKEQKKDATVEEVPKP
ncbi:hypothetical protein HQ520_16325 [bacterium]|nr:hypothetical protein [bacterium]